MHPWYCLNQWFFRRCTQILFKLFRTIALMVSPTNDVLWVTETGWSSPQPSTLDTRMAHCPEFSSPQSFQTYYSGFLSWNLSLSGTSPRGPDHIFFFTVRDSNNFGMEEHFGLIDTCSTTQCKLQESPSPAKQVGWASVGKRATGSPGI